MLRRWEPHQCEAIHVLSGVSTSVQNKVTKTVSEKQLLGNSSAQLQDDPSRYERHLHLPALDLSWSLPNAGRNVLKIKYNSRDQLITQMGELYVTAIFRMEDEFGMSCLWAVSGHGLIEWTECLPVPIVFCWLLLCSAVLCSLEDSLHLHVILHQWLAFYSAFLNIHRSGIYTALTWLVPHETAAVSVHSVYTIQPCSMSLHAKPHA